MHELEKAFSNLAVLSKVYVIPIIVAYWLISVIVTWAQMQRQGSSSTEGDSLSAGCSDDKGLYVNAGTAAAG